MKNTLFLIFFSLFVASCGQDYNSNYGDYGQYAPIEGLDSSTPDGARLLAAYKVMQSKCFSCHSAWAEFKSSAAWVASGRVVAASTTSSTLYTEIANGNMPQPPVLPLTSEESAKIEAWINGIP